MPVPASDSHFNDEASIDQRINLVNAHTHSEWFGVACLARGDGMIAWLRRVLAQKKPSQQIAFADCIQAMKASRVTAIGDYGARGSVVSQKLIDGRYYVEIIRDGSLTESATALRSRSIAPHAVHTVLKTTLEAIAGHPGFISVHAGESIEEMKLYTSGKGPMAKLLAERGFPDEHVRNLNGRSPMRIMDEYRLLGPRTQVVHALHLPMKDLELIAERNAHIVLCPISNRDIGTGFTPATMELSRKAVETMLELGISLALGTDSPLSASSLSLQDNAVLLQNSGIDIEQIRPMLTNRAAIGI